MSRTVFVSHSSRDSVFAREAVDQLEARGIRCWISSRDIPPGSDWAETIYDAIAGSSAVVLLFTAHSNESWQVRNELDIATNLRIPIIPVRLDDTHPGKGMRYFTNAHQWLDCRGMDGNGTFESIHSSLQKADTHSEDPAGHVRGNRSRRTFLLSITAATLVTVSALLLFAGRSRVGDDTRGLNLVVGGSESWDYAYDVVACEDGSFLASGTWDWCFWSDVWVVLCDSSGTPQWVWYDSLAGESMPLLQPLGDGRVLVAYGQYADFDHTGYRVDAWILDSLGRAVWGDSLTIVWPGAVQPELRSIEPDGSGLVWMAFTLRTRHTSPCDATHLIALDPDEGTMTWDTIPGCKESCAFLPDSSGGFYSVFKQTGSSASGVSHLGSDLSVSEEIVVGDRRTQATAAVVTEQGDLLVCFNADVYGPGNGDLLVMEFSPTLDLLWQRTYGGALQDRVSDIALLDGGRVLLTGSSLSFGDGSSDGWILLLDRDGEVIRQTTVDLGGDERIFAVSAQADGSCLVAGTTTRFLQPDAWILEITPEGGYDGSPSTGFTLFQEGWDQGFLDQAVWVLGANRNYSPSILADTAAGDYAIDLNCVPILSRTAFEAVSGLSLSAEVFIDELPSASGANRISIGMTTADPQGFLGDPASAVQTCLEWTYTNGINGQTRSVSARCLSCDSLFERTDADTAWLSAGTPQTLSIELTSGGLLFLLDDALFMRAPVPWQPSDSVRILLNGISDTAPHSLDDIRVFQRMWR